MPKYTVFIVPHGLDLGSGCRRTPPRAGKEIMQTIGECKTCTISEIHLGKVGKQPVIADLRYGLDFGRGASACRSLSCRKASARGFMR